jgi:adenylate cyclase
MASAIVANTFLDDLSLAVSVTRQLKSGGEGLLPRYDHCVAAGAVSRDVLHCRGIHSGDIERFVAIMFVDIRQSTALVEKRLPYDVVFLLNRFFDAVAGAVVEAGGAPNQFVGDGMMAIFGIRTEPQQACRQALAAAQLIHRRLAEMNRTMADELPRPIAVGVGLHAGNVILGELGYGDRFLLTAIGDSVHVAARLQDLTKEYGCQLVASEIVATTAGIELVAFPQHEVQVRGREAPLAVRIVGVMESLVI